MTGQVKESVLMRRGELGILVEDGCLLFEPWFVKPDEFDDKGCLSFTVCGLPVRYMPCEKSGGYMVIRYSGREPELAEGCVLPESISQAVFFRESGITGIDVMYCASDK
jgi:hypothetical protein